MAKRTAVGLEHSSGAGAAARVRLADVWIVLALLLATFSLYAQVRDHQFLIYDDPEYVLENPNLRLGLGWESVHTAFSEPYLGNWAPLTSLSLQLDYELYGLEPKGYLLGNVAWHALASVLLYAAFVRLTGARGRSAFVAGIFALHPLHVESVAWVSERKDVLAAAFFMLGLYTYAGYAARPRPARLLLVIACLGLGLLAKATLVTFPFVLLLLDGWPLGRLPGFTAQPPFSQVSWRRALLEKLPLFACVAVVAAVTFVVQREAGSMHTIESLPFGARFRNALEAYVRYAASSFWPSGLAVIYPLAAAELPLWRSLASASLLASVSVFTALSARVRPYLAVGWFWYLGMLVPMIGIVQVGRQSHADRYMYLPLIGLSLMLAWGGCELLDRLRARRLAVPAAMAILAALWLCSWRQLPYWRDSFVLFERALAVTENNAIAHLELGVAYMRADDVDAAEHHYAQSSALDPDWVAPRLGLADVRAKRGDLAGAIAAYERELVLNPHDTLAAGRYGFALVRAGRLAEAQLPIERALATHPGSAPLHAALAVVHGHFGRLQDAIRSNREALRFDPRLVEAANNLAWLLATRAESTTEERREAVYWAERANLASDGKDPAVLDTLAVAYAAGGRFNEAVEVAARAANVAETGGQPQIAAEIRSRGAQFASGHPWLEPPPALADGEEHPVERPGSRPE